MPSHPFDFEIQSHVYSTPEGLKIFEETSRFTRWLNFESALAESQAELGIIPEKAARKISKMASLDCLDFTAIKKEYTRNRNSLTPLLKELRRVCGKDCGQYIHYGATTQDVLDTGQILEIKETLSLLFRDIRKLETLLMDMAGRHRTTPMIGRTHSQQAIPITFGLKAAIWLSEIRRHNDRVLSLTPRILTGQLHGAVGTMAALGPLGREVAQKTMQKLGLKSSIGPWHTARDNIAEVAGFYALLTSTTAKIANEIFQLGKTEILEVREPQPAGKTSGSSTMPHKRNPVLCERIAAMSSHTRALAGVTVEAMQHENERDPRSLWSEWLALPQIAIYTITSTHYLIDILQGLEIDEQKMLDNLRQNKESILSEWLMFTLGKSMGKARAQEKLTSMIGEAEQQGRSLFVLLSEDTETSKVLTEDDYKAFENPETYIGLAPEIVDDIINDVKGKRQRDPKEL